MTSEASPPNFDLRLLIPALTAWAALVVLVLHSARTQLGIGLLCRGVAALVLRAMAPQPWRRHSALVALCLTATALVLILSAAHRAFDAVGPLSDLAQERAVVTVTGTVLTEPRLITRGGQRQDLVVF